MVDRNAKCVFLFPGQGSQYQGMALDFLALGGEAVSLFKTASSCAGRDMEALLRDSDAETLKQGDIVQPAITLANLCAAASLKEKGFSASGAAGHSLGEYAALVWAGVISVEDCFKLVCERGRIMREEANKWQEENPPGMAAVIGLPPEEVEGFVARWTGEGLEGLYAANFNSPRQTAISGTARALEEASARFKEAGAKRVIPLQVSMPSHSPLLAGAAEIFKPVLESVTFRDPAIVFYSNVTGKEVNSGEEAKRLALLHITNPVRWVSQEALMAASGVDCLFEAGPGKVLQGLWKDTGSELPCYLAGTAKDQADL